MSFLSNDDTKLSSDSTDTFTTTFMIPSILPPALPLVNSRSLPTPLQFVIKEEVSTNTPNIAKQYISNEKTMSWKCQKCKTTYQATSKSIKRHSRSCTASTPPVRDSTSSTPLRIPSHVHVVNEIGKTELKLLQMALRGHLNQALEDTGNKDLKLDNKFYANLLVHDLQSMEGRKLISEWIQCKHQKQQQNNTDNV